MEKLCLVKQNRTTTNKKQKQNRNRCKALTTWRIPGELLDFSLCREPEGVHSRICDGILQQQIDELACKSEGRKREKSLSLEDADHIQSRS